MDMYIMDDTDRELIRLLQQDARLTIKELAYKMGKRPTTIHSRYTRLLSQGILKGSIMLIDPEKFRNLVFVFVNVQLNDHCADALQDFQDRASALVEVRECYQTTGQVDFVLKAAVQDMPTYRSFVTQRLASLSNIKAITSHFVISETKRELGYPIERL